MDSFFVEPASPEHTEEDDGDGEKWKEEHLFEGRGGLGGKEKESRRGTIEEAPEGTQEDLASCEASALGEGEEEELQRGGHEKKAGHKPAVF